MSEMSFEEFAQEQRAENGNTSVKCAENGNTFVLHKGKDSKGKPYKDYSKSLELAFEVFEEQNGRKPAVILCSMFCSRHLFRKELIAAFSKSSSCDLPKISGIPVIISEDIGPGEVRIY